MRHDSTAYYRGSPEAHLGEFHEGYRLAFHEPLTAWAVNWRHLGRCNMGRCNMIFASPALMRHETAESDRTCASVAVPF